MCWPPVRPCPPYATRQEAWLVGLAVNEIEDGKWLSQKKGSYRAAQQRRPERNASFGSEPSQG